MVGIVDPPRAEAKAAIAECRSAGIRVRMITGDHATTAAAIATELGIEGRAISGTEFSAMTDEELLSQLPEIGVIARVAPEDKIRLVRMLQQQSNIVAMTGDGVNDAPALKAANIGVAMGITGTEVSKEAAVMILTDDNFATIVERRRIRAGAVRQPAEVSAVPDVDTRRLHRDVPRGRHLRHRRWSTAEPHADPLVEHGDRHPDRGGFGIRRADAGPHETQATSAERAGALAQQLDTPDGPGPVDVGRRVGRLSDR